MFGEDTKQTDVFSKVQDLVDNALNGVNCSVIFYGQTGSGKTHTMTGGPRKQDGVLQQTIHHIYSKADEYEELNSSCTMVQVYKSDLADLLRNRDTLPTALEIWLDSNGSAFVDATQVEHSFKE